MGDGKRATAARLCAEEVRASECALPHFAMASALPRSSYRRLKAQTPSTDAEIKKLIRIDRVEMNQRLDTWAEMWTREFEAKG
jgi:hypothetical protein